MVWLCWVTVVRGFMPSKWASSFSSKLVLCSTTGGAAPGGISGTGSGSASGTLPRAADGILLTFFPFGIGSSASASACLFFFFFLSPFYFFSRGGSDVVGSGSSPWPFFCFNAFFFPPMGSSGGLVFLALFFLVAHLPLRTHQVSQATSFQLILIGQFFVWVPNCIALQNLVLSDVHSLEFLNHLLHPPVHLEGFLQTCSHAVVLIPCYE